MIIHRHHDGSEGFEYEPGDRVIVERTIHGGWFDIGPTTAERCTVRKVDTSPAGITWRTATIAIHYSDDWGLATCLPWQVKPHPDTYAAAAVIEA